MFLVVIALICLIVIDHPPATVRQNCDYFKVLPQPKSNLFSFVDRIAQILCLNGQNDETDMTIYLVYLFCRNRIILSILQALFRRTNKRELSW